MSNRVWIIPWVLAALLSFWWYARAVHAPQVTNDGYQYLDVARSVIAGEGLATRVVHFDEQVAAGRMPAPFTHFPPGYPLLLAAVSRIGISFETAGLLISGLCFLTTLCLIWFIGRTLGARVWALAAVSALWVANSQALSDATTVGSEAAFTVAVTAIAAVLVRDLRDGGRRPVLLLCLGVLAGIAYWLRYAGLFVIPPVGVYLLWRGWRTREARWWAFAGILAAAALDGSIMIRNTIYTGSWRGGFSEGTHRTLAKVIVESSKSYYHQLFGDRVVARLDIWAVLFCLSFAAIALLIFEAWRKHDFAALPEFVRVSLAWIASILVIYVGGITATFLFTIASDLTRYNRPVFPLILAAASVILSVALRGSRIAAGIALVVAILGIHSRSLMAEQPPAELHLLANQMLSRPVEPGETGGTWLREHVAARGVIVSVNGQAVHYVLQRNVVSVMEPAFSNRHFDEQGFHLLMMRYHARYLLLFPGLPATAVPDQESIPFLHNLAVGSAAPPEWLRLAERNSGVAIYECATCSVSVPGE